MKNLKFEVKTIYLLYIFWLYLFISLFISRNFIKPGIIIGDAGSFAPTLDIFLKNVVYEPSWHEMLSKPTRGWIYSPHSIFYFLGKIFGYDVSTLIKLEYILFCTLSGFSMFILSRYMLQIAGFNKESVNSFVACFLSGLMYMLNLSFRVGDAHYIGIQYSFSVFPLIIFFFLKALYEKGYRYAILSGFWWVEAAAFDQRYLIAPLIVILPYLLIFSYDNNLKKFINNLKNGLNIFVISCLVFSLLGGYLFFSIIASTTVGVATALTKPAVDITWSNGNIINLMRASSHFQLPKYIDHVPFDFLIYVVVPTGLILTMIALLSIFFHNKNRYVLFFLFLFLIVVGLFAGLGKLSKNFIYWFVLDSPFNHFIGRLFRTTRIPDQIVVLSLSILLTFSIRSILDKLYDVKYRNFIRYCVILFTLFLILLSSAPLLTGDVAGRLYPIEIPEGYKKANEWLQLQDDDFKVIWIPEFWGPYQPEWSKGKSADALTYYGSSKPTYFARNNIMTHYYAYTLSFRYNSLLVRDQINALHEFISPLNIKYIFLHNDIPQYKKKFNDTLYKLRNNPNLKLVASFDPIYIFEIKNYDDHISIKNDPILVFGGLETGKHILYLNNYPILFADAFKINLLNKSYINKIILTPFKNNIDLAVPFIPKDYIIEVAQYSRFYQRDKWSRAYITDPHHGIWHGFINSFPNQKWEFSYRISYGFIFISNYQDSLEIPIIIEKNTNYLILTRVLKNTKGGEIKISVANFSKKIDTTDETKTEFVWIKVGKIYLTKGKYTLKLENIEGSNAVNLFVIIPEKECFKAKKEIGKLLQNKKLIYLFKSESDLYRSNNTEMIKVNVSTNNGEVLLLGKNDKVWQDIEVFKNGSYRIALNGIGEFKVKIGNHSFILNSSSLNFTYTPIFYLNEGERKIEIISLGNTILDTIWLYSTETNQTIEQLFEVTEKPAEVINYTKINPTLWKVKLNASKPFMLSFAEAYDPLWEARVYRDGRKIEVVKSIPLYSVINGFWINETGNLEIVIRYKPQDWFERGLIISVITFIGCVGYLFYDWRRERGDGWARRLEKRVKGYLEALKKKLTIS